ncbi:hypothetical protein [Streptomyces sp. NPDC058657]|uniref:hypothetical protein n=1 Tax=unclassified Streptomyces TaxID=2593676 RepID=UPI00365089A4
MSEAESTDIPQRVGPWLVYLRYESDADPASGPSRILITRDPEAAPEETEGGLSSTMLRKIDFQAAAAAYRESRGEQQLPDVSSDLAGDALRWLFAQEGLSDAYLAFLAEEYVRAVARAVKNVAGHLAELTGKRPETVRAHLKEARKRGLLTTIPGKAGGHLTPRAREIVTGEYLDKITDHLMDK